ncbi:MAG: response regulator [Pseudolabrys sp.]|nr:response regulator [Pseudolabrys sp.]
MTSAPIVLLVEDEPMVREMIAFELDLAGFQVLEAASAEDGLRLLTENARIDLLFTDIRLPGKNGWQLAEEVRGLHPGVPIVYASGYSDLSQPLSHSKFLQKPYRPSQVLQAAADLGIKPPPAATN